MTKDLSHRAIFFVKIRQQMKSVARACAECHISISTGRRWIARDLLTGTFAPARKRTSIEGVMCTEHQEILIIIVSNSRTLFYDELAVQLYHQTGYAYTSRQIRQCLFRRNYVYKLAGHQSPIERDLEYRRYYRERVIYPGGPIRADQLLYIDESSKKIRDCIRTRVHCPQGDIIDIPVQHRNSGNAASVIASFSLEGVQSITPVDINEEGNVDGQRFMQVFKDDILVICEQYPGKRSIVILDNAQVHMKHLIDAACEVAGVIAVYLPPYSFDYNPIELIFNTAKTLLKRRYGVGHLPLCARIGDLFMDCMRDCCTPDQTCNYFQHCHVPVTAEEREWANR